MRHSDYLREQAEKLQLLEEFAEDRGTQFQSVVDDLGQSLKDSLSDQFRRWKNVLDAAAEESFQVAQDSVIA